MDESRNEQATGADSANLETNLTDRTDLPRLSRLPSRMITRLSSVHHKPRKFWLLCVLSVLVGLTISRGLEHSEPWINFRYSVYQALQHVIPGKAQVNDSVILLVDDDDYWNGAPGYPGGRAPISREYLATLIGDIAQKNPKVIALDFDLRAQDPGKLCGDGRFLDARNNCVLQPAANSDPYGTLAYRNETHELVREIHQAVARGVKVVLPKTISKEHGIYFQRADIYQDPQLQGHRIIPNSASSAGLSFGYIALPHQTWRMPLMLTTRVSPDQTSDDAKAGDDIQLSSFSEAAAEAYRKDTVAEVLNRRAAWFFGWWKVAPFGGYLEEYVWTGTSKKSGSYECEFAKPGCHVIRASSFRKNLNAPEYDHIAGKIVFIGAAWHKNASHEGPVVDTYDTPAGKMPGVFVHANYAEALLAGRVYSPFLSTLLLIVEIALGYVLYVAFDGENINTRILYGVVPAIIFFVVGGWMLFFFAGIFLDFTIAGISLGCHAIVEHITEEEAKVFKRHKSDPVGEGTTSPELGKAPKHKTSAAAIAGLLLLTFIAFKPPKANAFGPRQEASKQDGSSQTKKTDEQSSNAQSRDANTQSQTYHDNDIDPEMTGGARNPKIPWVIVQMVNAKGDNIGRATITSVKTGGVEVKLDLSDLPPGEHALHFHQMPKCDAPDFKSAGAHFNPEKKEHGLKNPKGPHAGDMENFTVGPDGITTATVKNPNVTLGGKNSLLANGGTALVVHAKADDMKTDPAGNAGERIACGVVSHK